ncbi:MAG: hypothetical protein ACOYB4_04070 [Methyloceanibacter sp.]
MILRALLLAPLLVAAIAAATEPPGFTSGVWQGKANFDEDGRFRDCTMTAQSGDGIQLGFVISKDFNWGLVLADESRDLQVGSTLAMLLLIDERDPIAAVAKVVDVHGVLVPLANSDPVIEALRQGKVLRIVTQGVTLSFKLTGTNEAIAKLAACVTDHVDSERT